MSVGQKAPLAGHQPRAQRKKAHGGLAFTLFCLLGAFAGYTIATGIEKPTWIAGFALIICLPLLARIMGSLHNVLMSLFIVSLSTPVFSFDPWRPNPLFSDDPGMPVPIPALIMLPSLLERFFGLMQNRWQLRLYPWISLPLGLLIGWALLTGSFAPYPLWFRAQVPGLLSGAAILLYLANLIDDEQDLILAIKSIAFSVILSGALALIQYAAGPGAGEKLGGLVSYWDDSVIRVTALSGHPNDLAIYLASTLPLLMLFAMLRPELRRWCLTASIMGFGALLMTFSRGGWIGLAIGLLIVMHYNAGLITRNMSKVLIGVLLAIPVAGLLIIPLGSRLTSRVQTDDDGSAYSRIPLAETAIKIILNNPIMGVGLGNYKKVVPDYDSSAFVDVETDLPLAVHNLLLNLTAETGLPGGLLFILLLLSVYWQARRNARQPDTTMAAFAQGSLGGLAALFMYAMIEDVSLGSNRYLMLCALSGFILATTPRTTPAPPAKLD